PKPFRARPLQGFGERWFVGGWIPLHKQELDRQLKAQRLLRKAVDEELRAGDLVPAVLIVARRRDDAQSRIRRHAVEADLGRAVIIVCQPSLRSSQENHGVGSQRKYQTHSYSYFTYLSILYGKMWSLWISVISYRSRRSHRTPRNE